MTPGIFFVLQQATPRGSNQLLRRSIVAGFSQKLVPTGTVSVVDRRFSASSSSQSNDERDMQEKSGQAEQRRRSTATIRRRQFSSSLFQTAEEEETANETFSPNSTSAVAEVDSELKHQRIWFPGASEEPLYWKDDVANTQNSGTENLASLLDRIEKQELEGTRMRVKQYGVLHEDPVIDMRLLTENYTTTSLASALRDREETLQYCAQLAAQNDIRALRDTLQIFHPDLVVRRRQEVRRLDVKKPLDATSFETIRKALMRMPRRVSQAHTRRAGVVIPICHVDGVPSLLLEKRATSLRAHPDEVCLPGGMVCEIADKTIVETCLREMKEEICGLSFDHTRAAGVGSGITVLGVLRCNWGEVHHLVGVAVTPVVCVLGKDLGEVDLKPNPDEVAEVFTIPLASLLDKSQWIYKDDHAPIFVGGPYVIWGLTGYILERFWKDVLLPWQLPNEL